MAEVEYRYWPTVGGGALLQGRLLVLVTAADRWLRELADGAALQLAICYRGKLALSVWGGYDPFRRAAVDRYTLFPLLSATKGIASLALLHLHHRGYFGWQDRIAAHWPEFGQHGKDAATVEQLLSHRLGLPNLTAHWSRWPDRSYMRRLVEEAHPAWEPGARYGYHGGSWGVIVDELVRRWTGASVGEVVGDLLAHAACQPTESCFVGMPAHRYRHVARLHYVEHGQRIATQPLAPLGRGVGYNAKKVLVTCQSSGGGVATADGLARLYGLLACEGAADDGTVVWTSAAQAEAGRARNAPQTERPGARPGLRLAWGLGFVVHPSPQVFGVRPLSNRVLGHPGASGALGYADPMSGVSVALTINGVHGKLMYQRYEQLGGLLQAAVPTS